MPPIKELCRLLLTTTLSDRRIGEALGISPSTAGRYRDRLTDLQVDWPHLGDQDEATLDRLLNTPGRSAFVHTFVEPDWSYVHAELQRRGVTVTLLHEEYASTLETGVMSLTEFRRRLARYQRSRGLVMRQVHRPGECLYLDFSGVRPVLFDPDTGAWTPVELFVAVLGVSRKTFAWAVPSQKLPHWIAANVKAAEYFGGVTAMWVPDNLKAAVVSNKRGEGAILNPSYAECADHYGALILPARPRRPKDKAAVELGVKLVQRWILARLRHRVFTTLDDLNRAIAELLEVFNAKPMRGVGGKSRQQLFEALDQPALKPLPAEPYTFAEWQIGVRVGQDYHVRFGDQYYSVPHTLIGALVNLRASHATIELYHRDRRVASHARSFIAGFVSTSPEHRPPAHQGYADAQPAAVLAWAQASGGAVGRFVQQHLDRHRRPALSVQMGRRLQRLARTHGLDRLQQACARALQIHAVSVKSVESILARHLDQTATAAPPTEAPLPEHENVRGADYYDDPEDTES